MTEDAKIVNNRLSYEPVNLYNLQYEKNSGKLREANTRSTSEAQSNGDGIFQINTDSEINSSDIKTSENPG